LRKNPLKLTLMNRNKHNTLIIDVRQKKLSAIPPEYSGGICVMGDLLGYFMRLLADSKAGNINLLKLAFTALFAIVLSSNGLFAQEHVYKYQRSLQGISDMWHSVDIPTETYSKLNTDFSDVRIIGIKTNGDTIEAPYILKVEADKYENKIVNFNLINEVKNTNGYYYTFKLPQDKQVNSVELNFNRTNFNWLVTLEGSQNQQEWFTILYKSRIVGIENENTSYKYTTLAFKDANYTYLRLKIPSTTKPLFTKAIIEEKSVAKGKYNSPQISSFKVVPHPDKNETAVLLSLKEMMPISYINLVVTDSIDYYRPITIEYAIDSIENKTGWHYLYKHLFSTTLSSLNTTGYNFGNTVLKHLRITVDNNDNEPLHFKAVNLHGNPHKLITRFTEPATYYLVYGNKNAYVPNYDITRFEENIPTAIAPLKLGEEERIEEAKEKEVDPLFKDDIWLWAIMILVIFILGWFSFKMLKN